MKYLQNNLKRILLVAFSITLLLSGCGTVNTNSSNTYGVAVTDALGNTVYLKSDVKLASGYGSFADCWQLAGGEPIGVTEDALEEQGLIFDETVEIIGTVKEINLEKVIALNPDYLMLSADLTAHLKLEDSLKSSGIKYGYFRTDTFEDYKALMQQLCDVTGRADLYKKNVTDVENRITEIKGKIPESTDKTVLLMRVYSTGVKAKRDDNLGGQILKELGLRNIADSNSSLLEDLSVEQIIKENPDYIFVSFMGSETAAKEYLKENIENNPAWQGLTAVENSNYVLLPKDLFHYKPNERWDESYEYLAKIVYGQIFE